MRRFTELAIILILSATVFLWFHPSESLPVYLLISIGFAFLSELLRSKENTWMRNGLRLMILALMLWKREFSFFASAFLYTGEDAGFLSWLFVLPMMFHWQVIPVGLLAGYFKWKEREFRNYKDKTRATSDALKENVISLERYNAGLKENESKSKQILILEERNRIARELHDVLGHMISNSILQIEVLKLTAETEGGKKKLQTLQDTLSQGMDEIRKQLHGMYDTGFSLQKKLESLQASTPTIGIVVDNQLLSPIHLQKERDMYTLIREALSNTMKHSDAKEFRIILKEQGDNHIMLLSDDGTIPPNADFQLGLGLSGMEDLVRQYHGKFNYYYRQGFCIHIFLPMKERE